MTATIRAPQPEIGIILVNWNRWADTIECLESVFRSTIPVRVVVVDNASVDASLDHVEAWAAGTELATAISPSMAHLSAPPVAKPLRHERFSVTELGIRLADPDVRLTLIDSGGNLGFAGGNNIGLKWLLAQKQINTFWLLNNDTVIEPHAAEALLRSMNSTHNVGMCGTIVRYYHRPHIIQALGGSRFNIWTGQSSGIGAGKRVSEPYNPALVAAETDFVLGASLGVSRRFLETVGLMEESYFLYFEEIDWSARNGGRFPTAFARGATVYHKEGGSIGSSGVAGARSAMSEYWLNRSRLRFIRLRRPLLLPWHWLLTIGFALRRLLRRQPAKAAATIRALFGIEY